MGTINAVSDRLNSKAMLWSKVVEYAWSRGSKITAAGFPAKGVLVKESTMVNFIAEYLIPVFGSIAEAVVSGFRLFFGSRSICQTTRFDCVYTKWFRCK